jgi:hypothetical protein
MSLIVRGFRIAICGKVLAYGDNALARANKTWMRTRTYKAVHQEAAARPLSRSL